MLKKMVLVLEGLKNVQKQITESKLKEPRKKKLLEAMQNVSMKTFHTHVQKHKDKYGMEIDQAVDAAYSEMRKACGVTGDKQMTPKETVAPHKSESIQRSRTAKEFIENDEQLIAESVGVLQGWNILGAASATAVPVDEQNADDDSEEEEEEGEEEDEEEVEESAKPAKSKKDKK